MFSAATPVKKPHTRASAAIRRSQSRASSIGLAGGTATPPPPQLQSTSTLTVPGPSRRAGKGPSSVTPTLSVLGGASAYAASDYAKDAVEYSDIDVLESQGVLLKTETHTVSLYGSSLPAEVQAALSSTDFYTDPFMAHIDHQAGYACLVGREHGYVWSLSKSSAYTPTCFTFPFPQASGVSLAATIFSPVPFIRFVSQGSTVEPGVLLVTTTGQLRFWHGVSAALSSVDSFAQANLSLTQGEVVRAVDKISPHYFILATSGNRLFSLRLVSSVSTSSVAIQTALISRSKGMLAIVGGLFGGASADPRAGILALTSVAEPSPSRRSSGGRILYAVTDRVVQQWKITESNEQFVDEYDVYDSMVEALHDSLPAGSTTADTILPEILDAKVQDDTLTLLVSFFGGQGSAYQTKSSRRQLSYAILQAKEGSCAHVKTLNYAQEPDPRPLSTPRLHVSTGTRLAFVAFLDVIVAVGLNASASYEESVSLRDSAHNRLVGAGLQSATTLTVLAAQSGLLSLSIDSHALAAKTISSDKMDQETIATTKLKGKLEQAVIFGDRQQNPLAFDLKVGSEGDLVTAAEAVSKEILASSVANLPNIIDLRAQLADRSARFRFLITFIHDNSLIHRLSKTSRRHLAWDAEKLNSAMALWYYHNARMGATSEDILVEAIDSLNLTSTSGEDPVRNFFRTRVDRVGSALEQMLQPLQQRATAPTPLSSRTACIHQVDEILTIAYKALLRSRIENSDLYGLPASDAQVCLSEPWSSRPKLLRLLVSAFEFTERIVQERSSDLGTAVDDEEQIDYGAAGQDKQEKETQKELKDFMAEIADYALAMHQERMAYLQSRDDDAQAVIELRGLAETYMQLRSHVIEALVGASRVNIAYDLAERYRDFKSLVVLCNDTRIGSPVRVQFYIEKYKEDFAYALYQWYLDNDLLSTLMTQDDAYSPMLTSFLKMKSLPRLSWLQDVRDKRYADASAALLSKAGSETVLAEKKLMLSLGKLAKASTLTREQLQSSELVQRQLEQIDDSLDIVASQDRLLQVCASVMDARDKMRSVEQQATACADRLCSGLEGEQRELVIALFSQLLAGNSLSTEDLMDLFTLQTSAPPSESSDFAFAVDVYVRDKVTPQSRLRIALAAVWRRAYLNDDWDAIRTSANIKSDEDLAALLRGTSLYQSMYALLIKDETASDNILRPSASLFGSTPEELDSLKTRFSSFSYFSLLSVQQLIDSYTKESEDLQKLIDSPDVRLEELYDEVLRLVTLDLESAGTSDMVPLDEDAFMQE